MRKTYLLFWKNSLNRYSINALLGALETKKLLNNFEIIFFNSIQDLNISFKSSVIFCFSFCSFNIFEIYKIVSTLKTKYKNSIFLAGGPHPSGDIYGSLCFGFDFVFVGESEESFCLFLDNFLNGNELKSTPGVAYLEKENVKINKNKKYVDLNQYFPFSKSLMRFGPLEITRGCPFACKYCQTSFLFGTKVRHRSILTILEWIKFFKSINLTDIRFITPNALAYGSRNGREVNIEAIEELLTKIREILPYGRIFFGSFPSEVRPEQLSEKIMRLLAKKIDNKNLVIGAQTGSERMLRSMGRQHTLDDVRSAVRLAVKYNFIPCVDFIFGLPGETKEDEQDTILFMQELTQLGARVHAHTFIPLPGTPWEDKSPGKISIDVRRAITRLISNGKAFGNWERQETEAEKLVKFWRNKFDLQGYL